MAKSRRSITRDSVFRDVGSDTDTHTERQYPRQGLPPEETRTHQTAVWLGDEEFEWLDNQCRAIQRGGWRSVTRSALLRALVRSARDAHVDLAGATGEVEIAERLSTSEKKNRLG
jgi:hypothetical protein